MEKGEKKLLLPGLESRALCMAGPNANHYTRTDYTNYNKILSITISEQIFEAKFLKHLLLMKKI